MKPAYWFYVGQHLFHGLPHENPLDHIETLKDFFAGTEEHEATKDYIICKLFKYSLSGNAISWLKLLPPGSLPTWNDVRTAFSTKFSYDARAEEIRDEI